MCPTCCAKCSRHAPRTDSSAVPLTVVGSSTPGSRADRRAMDRIISDGFNSVTGVLPLNVFVCLYSNFRQGKTRNSFGFVFRILGSCVYFLGTVRIAIVDSHVR